VDGVLGVAVVAILIKTSRSWKLLNYFLFAWRGTLGGLSEIGESATAQEERVFGDYKTGAWDFFPELL